jgi:predicted nucleic acid-binding protein
VTTSLVVDASAVINSFARIGPVASQAREMMRSRMLNAPHLLDLEVASALRRQVRSGLVDASRAEFHLRALSRMAIRRHAHSGLLARVWRLRDNFSSYDASYVALAEAMHAPLLTADLRLADAAERYCEVARLGG